MRIFGENLAYFFGEKIRKLAVSIFFLEPPATILFYTSLISIASPNTAFFIT